MTSLTICTERRITLTTTTRYFAEVTAMLQAISQPHLERVFVLLEQAYCHDQRIFIMGNGGSAATASHFALDLAKNTIVQGTPRIKAFSLTDHIPLITAWSNDTAYEHIFSEQLVNLLEAGDVVIGISASGNSANIINGVHFARQVGAMTVGLLGSQGGQLKNLVDAYVLAPGQNIEQEEDAHMILTHVLTRHMRAFVRTSERARLAPLSAAARTHLYSH
ncbi:D-sedoheptulose-7-phosphate isomerase [Dictyobacter arantiisoli]|uniref:Phosphoheptose isomerase n=1 Tax=Dictyobacter arantiisoli TaxID=2014874 RepID=A0A5A5T684_9CHLR|nr:SIS domain-containing protein [Dictyobacter arantiisoli]GCF06892.1 phosphoheptose isomerase [Dictyobacter arantiisoli]